MLFMPESPGGSTPAVAVSDFTEPYTVRVGWAYGLRLGSSDDMA